MKTASAGDYRRASLVGADRSLRPPVLHPLRLAVLALAVVGVAPGCQGSGERPALEVENVRLVLRGGSPVVSGLVRNPGTAPLRAQLTVGLYDAENQPIGDERVEVGPVPPGEARGFEHTLDRPAAGVRVRQVLTL